jgi:DNA invertase Pin-like site-specific DNA recombinase
MKIGYLSAFGNEKHLAEQRKALRAAGCELIFEDSRRGRKSDARSELASALSNVTTGDVLVVWEISALGGMAGLLAVIARLEYVRAGLRSVRENFDTSAPGGEMVYRAVHALSRLERETQGKKVKAGIAKAQRRGKHFGRPPVLNAAQIDAARKEIEAGRVTIAGMADKLGVCTATLWRALRREKNALP